MMIDSHCHLNMLKLDNYDGELSRLVEANHAAGVSRMLNVCVELDKAQEIISVAENFPYVYASVGEHPSDVQGKLPDYDRLVKLIDHPKVVAVGETGLDYHYNETDLDEMRESFRLHIRAAIETGRPLIIHTRDAREDTIKILREEQAEKITGVMHCFTESLEMAEAAMALGFYISFSGIVTFKNAKELQAVAEVVPLERILIETDAPYLTPVPFRGKPNEPQYVRYVAEKIAELKNISFDEVVEATSQNFFDLFKGVQRDG